MIPKNLNDITEADLQNLLDNSVAERRTIEYKRDLPGNADKDKKEFLADVSSFANASGGDLIYGIEEDKGTPKSIDGLEIDDLDKEILRLDNMIRSGIDPKMPFDIQPVTLSNSKSVLVIRVNKSRLSPHRVVFKGHDKFYSRGPTCKYSLSVDELRSAFNLSETIPERTRKSRENRITDTELQPLVTEQNLSTKAELQKKLQIIKAKQALLQIKLKQLELSSNMSPLLGSFNKREQYNIEEKLIYLQISQLLVEEKLAELE